MDCATSTFVIPMGIYWPLVTIWRVGPGTIPASVDPSLGQLLMNAAGLFVYLWSSGEAVRYHLRMRRRVALGLGDAMIAQQFAFWAISGLAAAGAAATATFYTFVLEASILRAPVPFAAVQLALFISAIGLWFAFFPPAFYRRRVSARAPAAG